MLKNIQALTFDKDHHNLLPFRGWVGGYTDQELKVACARISDARFVEHSYEVFLENGRTLIMTAYCDKDVDPNSLTFRLDSLYNDEDPRTTLPAFLPNMARPRPKAATACCVWFDMEQNILLSSANKTSAEIQYKLKRLLKTFETS